MKKLLLASAGLFCLLDTYGAVRTVKITNAHTTDMRMKSDTYTTSGGKLSDTISIRSGATAVAFVDRNTRNTDVDELHISLIPLTIQPKQKIRVTNGYTTPMVMKCAWNTKSGQRVTDAMSINPGQTATTLMDTADTYELDISLEPS